MKNASFLAVIILAFGMLLLSILPTFAQSPDLAKSSADTAPALKKEVVGRDERRQQILAGIHETRFSYTLGRVPQEVDLFAECYLDGHLTHRYQLTSADHWNKPEYAKGVFSLGWNYLRHEMTLINDNGFGMWNARLAFAPEIIESPMVIVGAEKPEPELRDTINDYPAKQVTIYPIIGLVGDVPSSPGDQPYRVRGQSRFELSSATKFLAQAKSYGSRACIIIYLFGVDAGGNPPFAFEKKEGFYVNSLPMN